MNSAHPARSADDFRAAVAYYAERKLATLPWWLGEELARDSAARQDWPAAWRETLIPLPSLPSPDR